MNRLSNSWNILTASFKVLMADKELLIFPIISSLGVLVVSLTFAVPLFLSNFFDSAFINGIPFAGFVVAFLFYLVQYVVIFFMNTALVGSAMIRLRGGDPTLGDGFRIASNNIPSIFGYALIAATVGVLVRTLTQRSKGLGRVLIAILGTAWNVATYLVVPVLAVEGVGPIEAIKRSSKYLRSTWGEQIAGNLGIGFFFGLLTFAVLLFFAPFFFLLLNSAQLNIWLLAFLVVLLCMLLAIIGVIKSSLEGIYTAAVYQYAAEGKPSNLFDEDLLRSTFRAN